MKSSKKYSKDNAEAETRPNMVNEPLGYYETSKIVKSSDDETEVKEIKRYVRGNNTCDGIPISTEKPAAGTCSVCGLEVSSEPGNFGYCSYVHCQAPLGRQHMRFYRDQIFCPKHYPNIFIRIYDRYMEMVKPK